MRNTSEGQRVLVRSKNGTVRVYHSLSAAARVLSGKGTDGKRNQITRRCREGGGYVGENFVQFVQ